MNRPRPVIRSHFFANRIGIVTDLVVVNRMYPDHLAPESPAARVATLLEGARPLEDVVLRELCDRCHTMHVRHQLNLAQLAYLRKRVRAREIHLPYLFRGDFAHEEVAELSKMLASQVASHEAAG